MSVSRALERAKRALDSYALIGDGDYTPQDAYGYRCAQDFITLAADLAAARAREQRATKALRSLRGWAYVEAIAHGITMPPNLAALLDAALVAEPAADAQDTAPALESSSREDAARLTAAGAGAVEATLAEPEGVQTSSRDESDSGSASAAADEPGEQ